MPTLTITITGDGWSDLEDALDEVKSLISAEFTSGQASNETGNFTFSVDDE